MLTDQWFVAMSKPAPEGTLNPGKSITQVALEVVADGRIQFYPDNWTTIYNQWLNNIQDWCISRQLVGPPDPPVLGRRRCSSPTTRPKPSNRPAPPA